MREDRLLVFFDGTCPFCVGWVKFLIDRDANDRFRFASLQSDWTREFFTSRNLENPGTESVLTWDGEAIKSRSEAVVAIAEELPGIWHFMRHLSLLPEPVRNGGYRFIARNRYRIFGRYSACWLPNQTERGKFLDLGETETQPVSYED